MELRPRECHILEALEFTSFHLASFEKALNNIREAIKRMKIDGATVVTIDVKTREVVDQRELPVSHEHFNEFILFQRELRRIMDARIREIRERLSKVARWLTMDPPDVMSVKVSTRLRANGIHGFGLELEVREQAAIMQAEAIYLDELRKKNDVANIRRLARAGFLWLVGITEGRVDFSSQDVDFKLTFPPGAIYFDRPDLFLTPDQTPQPLDP